MVRALLLNLLTLSLLGVGHPGLVYALADGSKAEPVGRTAEQRGASAAAPRTGTAEQQAELRRMMREHWERMPAEERRQMEERLREHRAQRSFTPAS